MDRQRPRPPPERRPRTVLRPPKTETIFVVIPGIGTLEPGQWRDDTGELWLQHIPYSIAPGAAVYEFPHSLTSSDNELWERLTSRGSSFASDLMWLVEHEKIAHCPIVIVAHSLGGVIVKEALSVIYERSAEYRPFLHSLAAVIFLGTPHSAKPGDWKIFANILHTGKGTQKKRPISNEEMDILAESCTKFEGAGVGVPIISIFETQKTKIRKGIAFGFNQKTMLIDEKFVVTKAAQEHILGIDADHRSLCNINIREHEFSQICEILRTGLDDARAEIANTRSEYRAPTVLDALSLIDEPETDSNQGQSSYSSTSRSDPLSLFVGVGSRMGGSEILQTQEPDEMNEDESVVFPIFMMPVAKNKDFFGREDYLKKIEDAFFGDDPDASPSGSASSLTQYPKTFAICGPGGMGKTQLAAEFVFRNRSKFDAVFWIFADRAVKIAEGFGKIASELKLVDENSPDARDPVVIREQVRGWLVSMIKDPNASEEDSHNVASWLIVFDNVDDPDELEDYWPLDGSGCVLFTSRDPYTKESRYLARNGVDLLPFDNDSASKFLSKITRRKEDGSRVAEILGGLPLAMTQIAGIIVRRGLSFDEFLQQYKEEESHKELFEHKADKRWDTYEKNLASVWALEGLKHGGVLLDTLAFLDPDGVDERILTQNAHQVSNVDFPRTTTTYFKAREELFQSSLIVKDKLAEKIIVHRIVQDTARSKMSEERYRSMYVTALALVSSVWPYEKFGWRHEVARWRVCEKLFPHLLRIKDLTHHVQPPLGEVSEDLLFVKLMNDAGWYHHESGNSAEAASFFENSRDVAERLKKSCKNDDKKTLTDLDVTLAEIYHNLGCVGTETNDPKGTLENFSAFKNLVVDGKLESSGASDLKVSIAWNELGNAWMLNKDWNKGEECFLEAIKATKARPDYDPTDMSFPTVNLGLAYWFTERHQEAAAVLGEGLGQRETKYGKDDKVSFITGRFLHAIGNVKNSQGLHDESFEYHKRGLNQYLATVGKNHHRTGDMHIKVAEHHIQRKDYSEAVKQLDRALQVFRNRPSLQPEFCRTLFKRSIALEGLNDVSAAKLDQEEAVKVFNKINSNAPKTASTIIEKDVDELIAFWSV